jgi:hypothetical protein
MGFNWAFEGLKCTNMTFTANVGQAQYQIIKIIKIHVCDVI